MLICRSVTAIAHINLRLNAQLMEQVCAFYVHVVGLSPGPRPAFTSRGYWLYAGGTDVLHLTEERPDDPRRAGRDLTFDHVALACHNWSAFAQRLASHGVAYTTDHVPGTSILQVFLRDPAGNGGELIFKDPA